MANYIINKNTDNNGNNEVHKNSCEYLPLPHNRVPLGSHMNAKDAVSYAKSIGWINADGCYYCCNEAHKG